MHRHNANDLASLFEKARAALAKLEKSKSAKEFFVELKDLDPSGNVKTGKNSKKDTKKKRVSLVLVQWFNFILINSLERGEG